MHLFLLLYLLYQLEKILIEVFLLLRRVLLSVLLLQGLVLLEKGLLRVHFTELQQIRICIYGLALEGKRVAFFEKVGIAYDYVLVLGGK